MKHVTLALCIATTSLASASELVATQQAIVDRYLQKSPLAADIKNDIEIEKAKVYPYLEPYAWRLEGDLGYSKSEAESFLMQDQFLKDSSNFGLGFGKYISTGTDLTLLYRKESIRSDNGAFLSNNLSPILNQDEVVVELRQSLFSNFLGAQHRHQLSAFKEGLKGSTLEKIEELERGILKVLMVREALLVAHAELLSARASFEQFEALAKVVRQKEQVGASLPGDSSRASAELENLRQLVFDREQAVFSFEQELLLLLGDTETSSVVINNELKPLEMPSFPKFEFSSLRPLMIQDYVLKSKQLQRQVADDQTRPTLDFVASYGFTGVEEDNGEAFSEMLSASRPTAYLGLELSYKFGSGYASNKRKLARLDVYKGEKLREHMSNKLVADERILKGKITNAVKKDASLEKSVSLRRDSIKKTKLNYERAQMDLDAYVNEVDSLLKAENELIRNKGLYRVLVHEYAALIDNLIDLKNLEIKP